LIEKVNSKVKSLTEEIRGFFNKRTSSKDTTQEANTERRSLAIENGEAAKRLLGNKDFALLFNLYRFDMLTQLEDSTDDNTRIRNAHYVAGVRDFVGFIEKTEYFGKAALKNVPKNNEMG
jgi:hypothetical protein